jgi:excisionase family DNA binding protein
VGEDATSGGDRPTTGRRATVAEAAEVLGISVEAVRGRIKRGTIGHERDGDRVFVLLDADRSATGHDQDDGYAGDRSELVALLRDQLEDLRSDRDAWREQARRSDYLLGSAMERTRELEGRLRELESAPPRSDREGQEVPQDTQPDAPGSSERGDPGGGGGVVPPEPQAATSRPWWRRVFGG